jgi:hypothetical protein
VNKIKIVGIIGGTFQFLRQLRVILWTVEEVRCSTDLSKHSNRRINEISGWRNINHLLVLNISLYALPSKLEMLHDILFVYDMPKLKEPKNNIAKTTRPKILHNKSYKT